MNAIIAALLLFSGAAYGHGLSPSRLESPSGSEYIAYRFSASNIYKHAEEFDVECFKGSLENRIECKALPSSFWVPSNGIRSFKVQIKTEGDGVYLVCTIQAKTDSMLVTRVCARWGVGVDPSPNPNKQRATAPNATVPARSRQNTGG